MIEYVDHVKLSTCRQLILYIVIDPIWHFSATPSVLACYQGRILVEIVGEVGKKFRGGAAI